MSPLTTLRTAQRGVVRGMATALLVACLTIVLALALGPASANAGAAERLAFAIRADAPVMLVLAAAVANVARLRFRSARDIAGSAGAEASIGVSRASAILQNTLEQAVLAASAHLLIGLTVAAYRAVIPALVGLFVLGRVLFWIGYPRGAAGRALGFGLTFYPTLGALMVGTLAALA